MALNTPYAHKLFDLVNLQYGDSAPTSGDWQKGDIILNSTPGVGATFDWICTAAGSPGTWYPINAPLENTTVSALTAAAALAATASIVTVSGFAGTITLAPAQSAGVGELKILALTTHSVTLAAASGNAIVGLNGAVTSLTASAQLKANGTTNWYRLS